MLLRPFCFTEILQSFLLPFTPRDYIHIEIAGDNPREGAAVRPRLNELRNLMQLCITNGGKLGGGGV